MSRVYIRRIDRQGHSETIGEVANSSRFFVAVWGGMLKLHGLHDGPTLDLKILGRLWSRVARLPRADGLIVAATFDRCWFHREVVAELVAAMCSEKRFESSLFEVGHLIEKHGVDTSTRGIAFEGSLASPWACAVTDEWHVLDRDGHACKDCGKRIQDAEHMLADEPCCRENEEATYAA
jgi:hypothetical protein